MLDQLAQQGQEDRAQQPGGVCVADEENGVVAAEQRLWRDLMRPRGLLHPREAVRTQERLDGAFYRAARTVGLGGESGDRVISRLRIPALTIRLCGPEQPVH